MQRKTGLKLMALRVLEVGGASSVRAYSADQLFGYGENLWELSADQATFLLSLPYKKLFERAQRALNMAINIAKTYSNSRARLVGDTTPCYDQQLHKFRGQVKKIASFIEDLTEIMGDTNH